MILSPSYQLPYVDPLGYEIVAAQDLEVLAERADSVLSGFDVRSRALLRRPSVFSQLSANTPDAGANADTTLFWDNTPQYRSGEGLWMDGQRFVINETVLNPDGIVLCGWTGGQVVTGTVNGASRRDFWLKVWDGGTAYSPILKARYGVRQNDTGTVFETGGIWMVLRLRPGYYVTYGYEHGNASGPVHVAAGAMGWMTYLMAAS